MIDTLKNNITRLTYQKDRLNILTPLSVLAAEYPGKVTFSSSFSYEDQVIAHVILNNKLPSSIFTLDTGRMFPETYSVWNSTNEKYIRT